MTDNLKKTLMNLTGSDQSLYINRRNGRGHRKSSNHAEINRIELSLSFLCSFNLPVNLNPKQYNFRFVERNSARKKNEDFSFAFY